MVASAVRAAPVVGSASRVSSLPDRALSAFVLAVASVVSAATLALVSAVRAAPVVGSASRVSSLTDIASSALILAVSSAASAFALVVASLLI